MRTWAQINLDAIEHNLKEIKKNIASNVKIMSIIKADAYGHGFFQVATTLAKNGVDAFGVATADEAIQLRNSGFKTPILIIGVTCDDDLEMLISNDIMLVVFNKEFAMQISDVATKVSKKAKIHIKLDTGMSRIGFVCTDDKSIKESSDCISDIAKLPNIEIDGIFSHFSTADDENPEFTDIQYERFIKTVDFLKENGINIPNKHICNSAGIINHKKYHLDMVRCGIITYGLSPNPDMNIEGLNLIPAMEFKSTVINVKTVGSDSPVSYGGNYIAKAGSKIATVAIGYADGYSRALSGKAQVLINGKKANIVGNICMDQMMVDVTDIDDIKIGDEVILFGTDGNNTITIESVADIMNTINYEIVCTVGKRVPRVYIRDNKTVNVLNYLV